MQPKRILVLGVITLLVGWVAYDIFVQPPDRAANVDQLRTPAKRPAASSERSFSLISDEKFDELARRGKGQPLPKHLEIEFVDKHQHWVVSPQGSRSEVKIPFLPGHLPDPPPELDPLSENPGFLGAQACAKCHQEKHGSFIHTAHHLSSRPASEATIDGSFQPGQNELETIDPELSFRMTQRDGDLFQRVRFYGWQFEVPFQIVTGSSVMGQTYLYWHGERLFQMNVTCLSSHDNAWVNSPGYADGNARYERPILARCLDCHATYADFREPPNHFTPDSLILGISCERCHGPGLQHVNYHTENPQEKQAHDIILPTDLSRRQRLDLCGQCHSGLFPLKGKPFAFRPGDLVIDHYHPVAEGAAKDGVHTSDQLARLTESKCFQNSQMTCIDCHNPHRNEKGMTKVFSAKCLNCHAVDHCGMSDQLGESLADNCYDCHMPRTQSKSLNFRSINESVSLELRDHNIRIDRDATREFLSRQKK